MLEQAQHIIDRARRFLGMSDRELTDHGWRTAWGDTVTALEQAMAKIARMEEVPPSDPVEGWDYVCIGGPRAGQQYMPRPNQATLVVPHQTERSVLDTRVGGPEPEAKSMDYTYTTYVLERFRTPQRDYLMWRPEGQDISQVMGTLLQGYAEKCRADREAKKHGR